MNSINQWLDVDELNRLAESLVSPVQKKQLEREQPDPLVPASASAALEKASERAKNSGIIASDKPQKEAENLTNWLTANTQCQGYCVVNNDGEVLQSSMPRTEWVNLIVSIAVKGHDSGQSRPSNVRIKVASNNYLQCIKVLAPQGPLLVALLIQNLLKQSQIGEFSKLVEACDGNT